MISLSCRLLRSVGRFKAINRVFFTRQRIGSQRSAISDLTTCRCYSDARSRDRKFGESESPGPPQPPSLRSLTTFHAIDRLDPAEWTLIYQNREYERSKNIFPAFVIGGIVCVLFLTFTLILVIPDLPDFKFDSTDLLFLGWPVGIGFTLWILTRFRRRFVLRLYQQRSSDGKRRYCIVWLSWLLRRKKFIYDVTQVNEAGERHRAVVNFAGNFKARNRPWTVKATYFERPEDYFDVRYYKGKVE